MSEAAVDGWLRRSLHDRFDGILSEAVPPELTRLIQAHGEAD